jgi:hypothetical protein
VGGCAGNQVFQVFKIHHALAVGIGERTANREPSEGIMRAQLNGQGRNGHVKPARANAEDRPSGDGAVTGPPLEPSATAAAEAPPEAEGRDASSGRFTVGNRFGKGNPHARRMAALRQAFLSAATEERMRELGEKLFAAAIQGDWQEARLFLLFVVGRPAVAVDPDRLDLDEWGLRQNCPQYGDVIQAAGKLLFERAFVMLRELEPGVAHTAGATLVPLGNLLSEAVQPGAGPATGPPPVP